MIFLRPDRPAVILAPMEGVTDAPFREYITRTGQFDYCVSEFIRVSSHVLPKKVFLREVPELNHRSCTSSGIPVQVQILGGHPERMAETAVAAVEAGAMGIDLNFGCPAPTVNRNDGGATLLQYPERLEAIVRAVRDAVPSHLPVSAKLRLGFRDPDAIFENSKRVEQGGASWITIHGRTKIQGYTPPAYWKPIGKAARGVSIPVVANGEIWSLQDFHQCREETGSIHFMIGRGALAVPDLAGHIRTELKLSPILTPAPLTPPPRGSSREEWATFFEAYLQVQPSTARLKQWARYLHTRHRIDFWDEIKLLPDSQSILSVLKNPPDVFEPKRTS